MPKIERTPQLVFAEPHPGMEQSPRPQPARERVRARELIARLAVVEIPIGVHERLGEPELARRGPAPAWLALVPGPQFAH
jgi:hypothetical protein